jgi:hypothetical protein
MMRRWQRVRPRRRAATVSTTGTTGLDDLGDRLDGLDDHVGLVGLLRFSTSVSASALPRLRP